MGNIIIQGIDSLLGSYFAARYLQEPANRIFYLADMHNSACDKTAHRVIYAAHKLANDAASSCIEDRLQRIDNPVGAEITAVWCFVSSVSVPTQCEVFADALLACDRFAATELNYVECDSVGIVAGLDGEPCSAAGSPRLSTHEISQRCTAQGLRYRIFRTSLVVGAEHSALEQNSIFSRFLGELHSFKAEIEERSSQYFDFQALRCLAPPGSAVNLIPVEHASNLLLRIGEKTTTLDSDFQIVNPSSTDFTALCERIGFAYGIGLLPVHDSAALNAIDRAFRERLDGIDDYLTGGTLDISSTEAHGVADVSPETLSFDEDQQITLIESLRRDQDEVLAARRRRVEELPGKLTRNIIVTRGSELTYFAAGETGPAVVVLNALGQGLEYWYRLLDELTENHRVIIWEPRGTTAPPPPFGLAEQVSDLHAVLQREGIESCHLIGWCTGPKVAINFYLTRPTAVRSMVFLNTTFKCNGSPEELDSPYEQNVASLCHMLVRKPAMAASVMKTFQSRIEADEVDVLQGSDPEQVSVTVLSQMNSHLRSCVVAPFKTEETTLNYAHQLIDFWSSDVRSKAAEVNVPVLLMAAEYDQVATPAASSEAANLFPHARHLLLKGATHYFLYDRPEFVAGLLTKFFKDPGSLPVFQSEQDQRRANLQETMPEAESSLLTEAGASQNALHSRSA